MSNEQKQETFYNVVLIESIYCANCKNLYAPKDEIQDSWERIRQIEKADLDFRTAEQVQVLN